MIDNSEREFVYEMLVTGARKEADRYDNNAIVRLYNLLFGGYFCFDNVKFELNSFIDDTYKSVCNEDTPIDEFIQMFHNLRYETMIGTA